MSDLGELSRSLYALHDTFAENGRQGIYVADDGADALVEQLQAMAHLARAMEIELAGHRAREAHGSIVFTAESLATDVMTDVLVETCGNVIRPKFGRCS